MSLPVVVFGWGGGGGEAAVDMSLPVVVVVGEGECWPTFQLLLLNPKMTMLMTVENVKLLAYIFIISLCKETICDAHAGRKKYPKLHYPSPPPKTWGTFVPVLKLMNKCCQFWDQELKMEYHIMQNVSHYTGTRTHCFLLCWSCSRSRSKPVWLNHHCGDYAVHR